MERCHASRGFSRLSGRPTGWLHSFFVRRATCPNGSQILCGGQTGLLILKVPTEPLVDNLRWEESRGGAVFPHLYGELPCNLVTDVFELPVTADGVHILPDELYQN